MIESTNRAKINFFNFSPELQINLEKDDFSLPGDTVHSVKQPPLLISRTAARLKFD